MENEEVKKKKMKPWLKAILIFVAVNIVIALPMMGFIEVLVLKGKGHKPSDMDYRGYITRELGMDPDAYEETYQMSHVSIPSSKTEGYLIPVYILKTTEEYEGFVIMSHGMNSNHEMIYPESEAFLKAGYNVVSFDQRKCGESTASFVSYGYYEGMDVVDVLEYALDTQPEGKVALWGQSMGGAAVENAMDETPVIENADYIVLDCPMGAMEELTGAPDIQNRTASVFNKFMVGYGFDDQSPYHQISGNKIPVLLILAGKENVIPERSIAQIKETLTNAPGECEVYTCDNASHADVWLEDPKEYEKRVDEFLK